MTISEATSYRITELCKEKKLSGYSVTYKAGIPASTYKSIVNGKSKNPGIVNINRIAAVSYTHLTLPTTPYV